MDVVDKAGASAIVGVTPERIRQFVTEGRFPTAIATVGRSQLWLRVQIEDWVRWGGAANHPPGGGTHARPLASGPR